MATKTKTKKKSSSRSRSRSGNNSKNSSNQGKTLMDVFEAELKDIYNAEKQLVKALPKVAEAAYSNELQSLIEEHLEETQEQVSRLEEVFSICGISPKAEKCEAMEGLIEESNKVIEDFEEGNVRDCALIIGAQKIEHYEIASYGSLCELAEVMGMEEVSEILDNTLEEEEGADKKLTKVAETINDEALDEYEMSEVEM
jgi:ferritin-like metal-binding protein YciE